MEAPPLTGTEVERTSVKRDGVSSCSTWLVRVFRLCSVSGGALMSIFSADLGALYGSAILHTLPASMQSTVMNAYKGTVNINPLNSGQ